MDPIRNPFVPGAGTQPPELVGRETLLEQARIVLERVKLGRAAKSFIAVGVRGVGKTVLLERIRQMADDAGYLVCYVEADEQKPLAALLIPPLRKALLDLDRLGPMDRQVKRGLRVLKSFLNVWRQRHADGELTLDVEPERGSADSGDLEADLPELFAALGQAARARGMPVVLLVDEIQYIGEVSLSALVMGQQRLAREALPMVLIGAGLPQVMELTGRSKFHADSLFDYPAVGPLAEAEAERALSAPVTREGAAFAAEALAAILRLTHGYPYFLQEWGFQAWNVAAGPAITEADVMAAGTRAVQRLDEGFFRARFEGLTPRERDYLRAMASLGAGPHRSSDIAEAMGLRIGAVTPLRRGLIGKGMVHSSGYGETAFTVPMFDEYLRRAVAEGPAGPEPSGKG